MSLAGALNFDNTVHRRQALWQSELAIQPKGELFQGSPGSVNEDSKSSPPGLRRGADASSAGWSADGVVLSDTPFLTRMEGLELVEADLKKTGISIGKHPMAFIRDELSKEGILSAQQSLHLRPGQVVSVAGAVIIRQRPMTANNVVFITLEDETGHSNFIVMPDLFERFRAVINQNDFLIIDGVFEERGMLKALYFRPINSFTAEVVSHNFH